MVPSFAIRLITLYVTVKLWIPWIKYRVLYFKCHRGMNILHFCRSFKIFNLWNRTKLYKLKWMFCWINVLNIPGYYCLFTVFKGLWFTHIIKIALILKYMFNIQCDLSPEPPNNLSDISASINGHFTINCSTIIVILIVCSLFTLQWMQALIL